MAEQRAGRRTFIKSSVSSAAGFVALSAMPQGGARTGEPRNDSPAVTTRSRPEDAPVAERIRFSVIGVNHDHIHSQIAAVRRGGGRFVSFFAKEPELADAFATRYPDVHRARTESEILEDGTIQLVVGAAIPEDRAAIGIAAMRHGKDVLSDKPGATSLEQLADVRRVQRETKRIYSILYSERLENPATVRAGELVKAGAIGRVIQTVGLGPHRMNPSTRPSWFFERQRYGGIICDIGSHQFDQFLFFTGSTTADVVAAQVGNVHHPQYPGLEDFGDVLLRGDGGTGYVRVDWFTPDGLNTWGDGRLTILGTDGFIEIRKNVDIGGRPGGNHLFLVDRKETRYVDCSDVALPFGVQLVDDVVNRTETAMSQEHCFFATELALRAQYQAARLRLER